MHKQIYQALSQVIKFSVAAVSETLCEDNKQKTHTETFNMEKVGRFYEVFFVVCY